VAGVVFSALVSGEPATDAVGQPAIPAAVKAAAIDLLDASRTFPPSLSHLEG
jgi:hypothetical protein